ncbi:hypothetical protein BWI93_23545 [Siphonobacter sp. BAB-5385]|uniref:hypothetical protein n=1 Tax=Siphonobacter sp. BAB-5385 TaxID=1864822 RepID=UPI000B9E8B7F|nr:hypothetical protein [Siphonobacter sp. BAB-5385]OZI05870.1 hypothetical protein BWI93_23545 [Siphonobacter sp. BAB-5385]
MPDALRTLFEADQNERIPHPEVGTPAYETLRTRDRERRTQVQALINEGRVTTAQDYTTRLSFFSTEIASTKSGRLTN